MEIPQDDNIDDEVPRIAPLTDDKLDDEIDELVLKPPVFFVGDSQAGIQAKNSTPYDEGRLYRRGIGLSGSRLSFGVGGRQTPSVATSNGILTISSLLHHTARTRSLRTGRSADPKSPTKLPNDVELSGSSSMFRKEIALLEDMSGLFNDDDDEAGHLLGPLEKKQQSEDVLRLSSSSQQSTAAPPVVCPLRLFQLSGDSPSLHPTAPPYKNDHGEKSQHSLFSFGTAGVPRERNSMILVAATQFDNDVTEGIGTLLPTTPTLPQPTLPQSSSVSLEIPGTQFAEIEEEPSEMVPPMPSSSATKKTEMMSQMDLFAMSGGGGTSTENLFTSGLTGTLTTPSVPSFNAVIVEGIPPTAEEVHGEKENEPSSNCPIIPESRKSTITADDSVVVDNAMDDVGDNVATGALAEPTLDLESSSKADHHEDLEDIERFSGHETVILPDSFDDDDNPFTAPQHESIPKPKTSPFFAAALPTSPEAPQAKSYVPIAAAPKSAFIKRTIRDDLGDLAPIVAPRTARKVQFAPTPRFSSPLASAKPANKRPRTCTQELVEDYVKSSLNKVSLQVISLPKGVVTGDKKETSKETANATSIIDEKLCEEGDAQSLICKAKTPLKISAPTTPRVRSAFGTPSLSKALNGIIEAITPATVKFKSADSSPSVNRSSERRKSIARPLSLKKRTHQQKRSVQGTPLRQSVAMVERFASTKKCAVKPSLPVSTKKPTAPLASIWTGGLAPGLLVWAKWKQRFYTAAILLRKKSPSRELWEVRPLHRRTATLDLTQKDICPIRMIKAGDPVLQIHDRRKYITSPYFFDAWNETDDTVILDDGSVVPLTAVVLEPRLFAEKHREWRQLVDAKAVVDYGHIKEIGLSSGMVSELDADDSEACLSSAEVSEADPAPAGLFSGWKFLITGDANKAACSQMICEYGGELIEEFPEDIGNVILIGEGNPCRTAKYFMAIILAVPRLKPCWLDDCVKKDKLLLVKDLLKRHRLDSIPTRQPSIKNLFAGISICFVPISGSSSTGKKYKESCESIASLASATIVDSRKLAGYPESVIVVTEGPDAIRPRLRSICLSAGHLIVDKTWFTDSILQARLLPTL